MDEFKKGDRVKFLSKIKIGDSFFIDEQIGSISICGSMMQNDFFTITLVDKERGIVLTKGTDGNDWYLPIASLQHYRSIPSSFAEGESIALGLGKVRFIGKIVRDPSSNYYYLDFGEMLTHEATCDAIEKIVPTFRELAQAYGAMYYSRDFVNFPTFNNLELLYDYYVALDAEIRKCSSLDEPVIFKVGTKVLLGIDFEGMVDYTRDYYYIRLHSFRGTAMSHENVCIKLEEKLPNYKSIAKEFNSCTNLRSYFPGFKDLKDLQNYCKVLDAKLLNLEPEIKDSFSHGDRVTVYGWPGEVQVDSTSYWVYFDSYHGDKCDIFRNIPQYASLVNQFNGKEVEVGRSFPRFKTAKDLSSFINSINEIYKQELKKVEFQESIISKTSNKNEIRFQKPKASVVGGFVPDGHSRCGKTSRSAIAVGHLSYGARSC